MLHAMSAAALFQVQGLGLGGGCVWLLLRLAMDFSFAKPHHAVRKEST